MVAAMQDATRGSRKSNIDRLLIAGALPRDAPAARAPHSLQTAPRRFQLQVPSRQSFTTIMKVAAGMPSDSYKLCMALSATGCGRTWSDMVRQRPR